jgi:hypothetical protein
MHLFPIHWGDSLHADTDRFCFWHFCGYLICLRWYLSTPLIITCIHATTHLHYWLRTKHTPVLIVLTLIQLINIFCSLSPRCLPFCYWLRASSWHWGHCPFGRPVCYQAFNIWCLEMLLQYIHVIFLSHEAIHFVKYTSPSCSKAPPQHDAATPVLHSLDGVLRLASLPLFPPNITMVIRAKQFYFCFIRPEDISLKSSIFVPMCSCKP